MSLAAGGGWRGLGVAASVVTGKASPPWKAPKWLAYAAAVSASVVVGRLEESWRFGVGRMVPRKRRIMAKRLRLSKLSAAMRACEAMLAHLSGVMRLRSGRKVKSRVWWCVATAMSSCWGAVEELGVALESQRPIWSGRSGSVDGAPCGWIV